MLLSGSVLENSVDCEEDLPKDALCEGSDDVDDYEVHEAEVEHSVAIILRIFPAVIEGNHRPACLCHDLNHNILSLYEGFKGRVLLVHVIGWGSVQRDGVVEKLHADDGKDIKEEEKKG